MWAGYGTRVRLGWALHIRFTNLLCPGDSSPQKSCEEYLRRELETNKLPSLLGEVRFFSAGHD
eukprot:scaffold243158_cov23-Cyclotella_meneghiniana.AAC.1